MSDTPNATSPAKADAPTEKQIAYFRRLATAMDLTRHQEHVVLDMVAAGKFSRADMSREIDSLKRRLAERR